MEISDLLIWETNPNMAISYSSRCDGATEIIPNSIEEVWQLLKMFAPENKFSNITVGPPIDLNHQLPSGYLIIYHRPSMRDFGYIDLVNLKEKIRNKNLNKITND